MITVDIPGFKKEKLALKNLVLDFNGTLAVDGKLIDGLKDKLNVLSEKLQLHIITGNSYGTAEQELKGISCKLILLSAKGQQQEKEKYITALAADSVSIGNGRNDLLMLRQSAIGIAVIQKEGVAAQTLATADLLCNTIFDAIDILNNPVRLIATLRS